MLDSILYTSANANDNPYTLTAASWKLLEITGVALVSK